MLSFAVAVTDILKLSAGDPQTTINDTLAIEVEEL
jgi:hypothetical protein